MNNLRPYHVFEIDGKHYVFSIWGMSYRRVSSGVIAELAFAQDRETAEISPETIAVINDLGLRWSEKVRSVADLVEKDRRAGVLASEKPPTISQVALFVTQDCNMRCPYCYGDGGEYGGGGPMSEKTALKAVDWLIGQAGDKKTVRISFFGGEPLLNFGLVERVVAYARQRADDSGEVGFSVTTNLSLLDDRILDFLVANKFRVTVSFDGPRDIQNRNRPLRNGRDSYDEVAPKVRKLLGALPHAGSRATLAAGDDPWEVARELLALGFRHADIQPPSGCLITGTHAAPGCEGKELSPHAALTAFYRDVASRFRQAVSRRDAEEARTLCCFGNLARFLPRFLEQRDLLRSVARRRWYYPCHRATTMVAVAVDGGIYPCHRFVGAEAFRMGNVHTGEFSRDGFLRSSVVENPECASCWAKYVCGGSCQHHSAAAMGDPLQPEPRYCGDLRSRIESAIHMTDCLGNEELDWLSDLGIMEDRHCQMDL